MSRVYLSGYFLAAAGWVKSGLSYKKNLDTIEYDGCTWRYYPIPECLMFTIESGVVHEARIIQFTDEIIR